MAEAAIATLFVLLYILTLSLIRTTILDVARMKYLSKDTEKSK